MFPSATDLSYWNEASTERLGDLGSPMLEGMLAEITLEAEYCSR